MPVMDLRPGGQRPLPPLPSSAFVRFALVLILGAGVPKPAGAALSMAPGSAPAPFALAAPRATPDLSPAPQVPPQVIPPDTTWQGKKILTVDDYGLWRTIGSVALSPDGRWVSYAYSRRETDDSLFLRPVAGGQGKVVVRGASPSFSPDSRWVAYYVNPPRGGGGRPGGASQAPSGGSSPSAARGGGGEAGGPRALELLNLQSLDTVRWENVQSFAFAGAGKALIVKKRAPEGNPRHRGTDLLVRYLSDGSEEILPYVNEWALDVVGSRLAWTVDGPEGEQNGVYLLDLGTRKRSTLDAERKASYARLTWGTDRGRPSADALAVLKGTKDDKRVETDNALLLWPALSRSQAPMLLDPRPAAPDTAGGEGRGQEGVRGSVRPRDPFPEGWVLSEKGTLRWSPDARRIFVGTRPQQAAPNTLCKPAGDGSGGRGRGGGEGTGGAPGVRMASRVDATGRPLGPEEVQDGICPEFVANVDIWHVRDRELQSVQMIQANRERNRVYLGVAHVEANSVRFVPLADTTLSTVEVSPNGKVAVGKDGRAYVSDWEPAYADVYLLDLATGQRTLILERHLRTLGFSPRGDHYLYWKDGHVWSFAPATGRHTNLTRDLPTSFVNLEYDRFGEKPPYGIAGWTADSTGVILEARYDLWYLPLGGGKAVNLTGGSGERQEIRFRILDLDPSEELVDLRKPLILTAYGQWTKKAGFYRLERGRLQELVLADARFGRVQKADSANVVLFTREDFRTFPDYWASGLDFANPVRLTDANPQQAEFNWGRTLLFDYWTRDSVRLQGVLAIPDDYRPGEKRPMLVDFYEKMSQNLHAYPAPTYRDTPMVAGYVSAGYLVLLPDIHFRLGATHSQMLECIELAIDEVEKMGYVDPRRIGLHGHSFSGQGSVYIATHSDRFAAIVAGAAATNLVSDFNQLWKSSGTNQHGYDIYGQGRFATSPYDDLELFLDQSATPNAARMNTPLLLLHGTADGSVEWLQAIEFFNGLRWFGKNVILASYPDEPHHLSRYENQKDFQIRMQQFYDHYLWDRPAPRWMTQGRPFLQKERDRAMLAPQGSGGGGGGGGGGDT